MAEIQDYQYTDNNGKQWILYVRSDGTIYDENWKIKPHYIRHDEYVIVRVGRIYRPQVHRLVALTMIDNIYNHKYVDHINQCRKDTRMENLRWVNCTQNNLNFSISGRNKSGVKGVYKSENGKKWLACISDKRKTIHLGTFDNINKAKIAYETKSVELFNAHNKSTNENSTINLT